MLKSKIKTLRLSIASLTAVLTFVLAACVMPGGEVKASAPVPSAPAPTADTMPAPVSASAEQGDIDPYAAEPKPLGVQQCAQCHPVQFRGLKETGGRHKFDCQNCHQKFHAYNPNKQNWDELMPQCSNCHTLPHGKPFTDCLSCHQNPHTPRKVPMVAQLTSNCGNCHSSPAAQLKQFPSAHTEQGCQACHESHGYIPACFNCHEPHYQAQPLETCTGCHPVHKPLQISFAGKVELKTCSACHGQVYETWSTSKSKHGSVSCVSCHTQHGLIPKCNDCHGLPHSDALHGKFPQCLTCHLDPHDPPVKSK